MKAIGLCKGHWYKCQNGHYYAIGDCGGATQRGKCPECGSVIGGEGHRLAAGNLHASEFDSSRHAAYSEEANNLFNLDPMIYDDFSYIELLRWFRLHRVDITIYITKVTSRGDL